MFEVEGKGKMYIIKKLEEALNATRCCEGISLEAGYTACRDSEPVFEPSEDDDKITHVRLCVNGHSVIQSIEMDSGISMIRDIVSATSAFM